MHHNRGQEPFDYLRGKDAPQQVSSDDFSENDERLETPAGQRCTTTGVKSHSTTCGAKMHHSRYQAMIFLKTTKGSRRLRGKDAPQQGSRAIRLPAGQRCTTA